jgi:hypothetical protein
VTLLSGSSSAQITAPIERCWEVVADVEGWPHWQGGLESVHVLERDADGRPHTADTVNDAKFWTVRCRVRILYEPPLRMRWTRLESDDIDAMDGSWLLEEAGPGITRATYELAVDPGPIPRLARPLERVLRPLVVGRRAEELARELTQRS